MLSTIVSRRPKLLLFALVAAAVLIFISTTSRTGQLRAHTQRLIQNSPFSSKSYTFKGQAILENAHLLQDADDFLTHFKGVVRYPSLLLSQTKTGCFWPNEDEVNLQWTYDSTRGDDMKWILEDEPDYEIEMIRKQWQYFVANDMRPWSENKNRFSGRGIVIPAGHEKSIHRTKVILRMLNKLGSTLPVEISHWGSELSEETKRQFTNIRSGVYFVDLSQGQLFETYFAKEISNFQLKLPSILNSRFAEIVLMDSDNIPIIDPAELFESDTYKEFGTIFWPDLAKTRRQNPIWAITNTPCRMEEWEQESGQLVVDKRKFWYHLQLAAWWETDNKVYYGRYILGDKDMFRFAWHALKTKFGSPARWMTSVGTLSPGGTPSEPKIFCGHSFAQHHPDKDGKVAFLHGGFLKTVSNDVMDWQLKHQGGIFQAYKRAPADQDKMKIPLVKVEWDPSGYLKDADKSASFRPAWCVNFPEVTPQPLEDLIPDFQKTYKDAGGYWMLESEKT